MFCQTPSELHNNSLWETQAVLFAHVRLTPTVTASSNARRSPTVTKQTTQRSPCCRETMESWSRPEADGGAGWCDIYTETLSEAAEEVMGGTEMFCFWSIIDITWSTNQSGSVRPTAAHELINQTCSQQLDIRFMCHLFPRLSNRNKSDLISKHQKEECVLANRWRVCCCDLFLSPVLLTLYEHLYFILLSGEFPQFL